MNLRRLLILIVAVMLTAPCMAEDKDEKKSSKRKSSKSGGASVPNQAEIDTILDKISQSGYESLSKEEKQKLFNASKK